MLVKLPARELAPVEPRHAGREARHRRGRRSRATQHSYRHTAGIAADVLEVDDRPTHGSLPQCKGDLREGGTVRRVRDVRHDVGTVKAPTGAIDLIAG